MNGMRDFYGHELPSRWRVLVNPHFMLPAVFVLSLVLAAVAGNWAEKRANARQKPAVAVQQVPKHQVAGPEFPQWKKS